MWVALCRMGLLWPNGTQWGLMGAMGNPVGRNTPIGKSASHRDPLNRGPLSTLVIVGLIRLMPYAFTDQGFWGLGFRVWGWGRVLSLYLQWVSLGRL